jgi:AcrR family transcriptional regulator
LIKKTGKPNRQILRTKSWVFDALMLLMGEMPYNKITVSDISNKAGITRPTFYRYYDDKDDVIFEYLLNTFSTELLNIEKVNKNDNQDTIVLVFDYEYMIKHQGVLKKILSTADIENRILHELQKYPMTFLKNYKEKLTTEEYLLCRYKLYYQITGSLRVIFDWFINDMPLSADNMISMINAMNIPKTILYRNIPSIVVQIKK